MLASSCHAIGFVKEWRPVPSAAAVYETGSATMRRGVGWLEMQLQEGGLQEQQLFPQHRLLPLAISSHQQEPDPKALGLGHRGEGSC